MILDARGNPIKIERPNTTARRGAQIDAFQLPKGAIIDARRSREFHNRIRNDARLRERLETADKMTGTKSLCLQMLKPGEMTPMTKIALQNNLEFGEKVMRRRAQEEAALEPTRRAYAA